MQQNLMLFFGAVCALAAALSIYRYVRLVLQKNRKT
jgi:hypothetical protein